VVQPFRHARTREAAGAPRAPIFVSPHFDDVPLSCGGTVARAARQSGALVATIFAGKPPGGLSAFARFQHDRWRTGVDAVDDRRREDLAAMRVLGADHRWMNLPDAIYRGDQYRSDDDLFGPITASDAQTREEAISAITALAREHDSPAVYLPLGVGGHVDHRICRAAAGPLADLGCAVLLYEDFPYACNPGAVEGEVERSAVPLVPVEIDVTDVFDLRLAAIAAYASQLPTIFRHFGPWDEVVRGYAASPGARERYVERFWRPVPK
jgi:LmbE family N-acetylglucosaminyl deacetylase